MKRKFLPLVLLCQFAALFFLIQGITRLYYDYYSKIYLAVLNEDMQAIEEMEMDLRISEVLSGAVYHQLIAFGLGLLLIGLLNWKLKASYWNSIVLFPLLFILFPLGTFNGNIVHSLLNEIFYWFSSDFRIAHLIGGVSLLSAAVLAGWQSWRIMNGRMNIVKDLEFHVSK